MRILIICMLVFVSGCGISTKFYNGDKVLMGKIEQDGPGLASYKKGDMEMTVDSRQPNFWERNIAPVLSGSLDRASRGR